MKLAIIGSRKLKLSLNEYIPKNCDEIVSGGAQGVDALAAELANNQEFG